MVLGRSAAERAPSLWRLRGRWEDERPCPDDRRLDAQGPMKIGTADAAVQAGWIVASCAAEGRPAFGLAAASGHLEADVGLDLVWLLFAFGQEGFRLGRQDFRPGRHAEESVALDVLRHIVHHWRRCDS